MAKPPSRDRRRRSPAARQRTKVERITRASIRRRAEQWRAAAAAAEATGSPLNMALTITWQAAEHGDRRGGHVLGLPETARERRVWSALRLAAARAGAPWLAARAPEYDTRRGLHLHLAWHLPATVEAMHDVIETVERLTGAPAEWIDLRGKTIRKAGRATRGVVAMSACCGWMLQRRVAALGDASGLVRYAAKGAGLDHVNGQHRLSNALSALVRSGAA